MALAFGEICLSEQLSCSEERGSGRGETARGLFKKFLISLIVHDNVQQFAGSCDDYQYQQFNRCWYAVP